MSSKTGRPDLVTITPQLAASWLQNNFSNRPLSKPLIKKYAGAIKRGEWELNGETIKFARGGRLLDGQHRLSAAVEANAPIRALVVRNLDPKTFHTIDNGKPRSTGDILQIKGEKNHTTLASVLARLHFYKRRFKGFNSIKYSPSIQQLEHLLDKYPVIRLYIEEAHTTQWCKKFITPINYAFCKFLFDQNDPTISSQFFKQLESGAGLPERSPILYLRERLMEIRANRFQTLQKIELLVYIFKAYKAFRDKKNIKFLRMQRKENLDLIFDLKIGLYGSSIDD